MRYKTRSESPGENRIASRVSVTEYFPRSNWTTMPHNIEMYDVNSRSESPSLYDDHQEYVELDDVEVGDEGALLGSPHRPERHSPEDLWPGVRGIILEVNNNSYLVYWTHRQ